MNIGKVKDIYVAWVKSGYRFGLGFSDLLMDKLEVSPKNASRAGLAFDIAAGAGFTYLAVGTGVGAVLGAAAAVGAVTAAPVAAVVTLATSTVWLALACVTGGIGVGLLTAAGKKTGLLSPLTVEKNAKRLFETAAAPVNAVFCIGAKLSDKFRQAMHKKPPQLKKPAPLPVIRPPRP
jgi:hypothetical protein